MENNTSGGVIIPLTKERRRAHLKRKIKKDLISWVFLMPFIIGAAVFTLYPIINSLLYSFSNYNGAYATKLGFFNYVKIFDTGIRGMFHPVMKSFGITFIYVIVSTVINLTLSYVLALFLNAKIHGMKAIRVLCYLPCLIPGIAGGLIWRDVLAYTPPTATSNAGYGLFNVWATSLGLEPFTFFSAANTSLITLLFTGLWGLGGGMIMWLAAFGNISPEYYEAAKIDGAGYLKRLFRITIPLSTPILFYNLVTAMIGGLQVFGTYATYGTGVEDSLYFIAIRIYRTAFQQTLPDYGLACAMAWLLFIVIGILTLIMFKTQKWVQYGSDNE